MSVLNANQTKAHFEDWDMNHLMPLHTDQRNVVVIGASAGGVQALQSLFSQLPAYSAAAFLVVLHLSPHTPSELHRVLQRSTKMRVRVAEDGDQLEAGTVFVASSDRHLLVSDSGIRITRGPKECRVRPAIDALFRSAASTFGPRAIGVVLSGTLDDGTAGLWAVKDQGGKAFVQSPAEAMHHSMPQSAMDHVVTDLVGTVEELAAELIRCIGETVIRTDRTISRTHKVENRIAINGKGLESGVMDLGPISKYTCPDCHGVLIQITEGSVLRFRCHTGHAFSLMSLVAEVNAAIDVGLWDTLRSIEERIMLLRQIGDMAHAANRTEEADRHWKQASSAEERLVPLRELVLDPNFFGHDPAI
jgi:two-component system chemotaxis response regulator CheB